MPTIFAASESTVLVDGNAVEGVSAIEYRHRQARNNVYALGSVERIGLISGPQCVEGELRVLSTDPALNALPAEQAFQIAARLRHGETTMTVSFDDCYLTEKSFQMEVGGQGEAVYRFSATRVREEIG